jgi:hypothetical protein
MASLPADANLASWAGEHLVYEARMLGYTAVELAKRRDLPRDQESNVSWRRLPFTLVACATSCAADRSRYPMDAFASDFCSPGKGNGSAAMFRQR